MNPGGGFAVPSPFEQVSVPLPPPDGVGGSDARRRQGCAAVAFCGLVPPPLEVRLGVRSAAGAVLDAVVALSLRRPVAQALSEEAACGVVPSPNRGAHESELAGLSVLAPDDIWAVGRYNSGRPPTVTGRDTLSLHWDGTSWGIVPTPNPT